MGQKLTILAPKIYRKSQNSSQHSNEFYLRTWRDKPIQLKITAAFRDICSVFRYLEKQLQYDHIILPDIMKYRDIAIKKLKLILEIGHLPGGKLEALLKMENDNRLQYSSGTATTGRPNKNIYVNSLQQRSFESIHRDTIQTSINVLGERLNEEQNEVMKNLIKVVTCRTSNSFVTAALPLLDIIPTVNKTDFINCAMDHWDKFCPPSEFLKNDFGVMLQYMVRNSKSPVLDFLASFFVLSPHSMSVERCVSAYNLVYSDLRTQSCIKTVNNRLLIYYNGSSTCKFDPKPVVMDFLNCKDRRMKLPDIENYSNRKNLRRFFKGNNDCCYFDENNDSDEEICS